MICKQCGTMNPDDSRFCGNCGSPLPPAAAPAPASYQPGPDASAVPPAAPATAAPRRGKPPVKLLAILGAAAAALVLILVLVLGAKPTIDLNKYMTIDVTGYNGYGRASVSIDWAAIQKKYGDKLKFTKLAKNSYGGLITLTAPIDTLTLGTSVQLDKTSGLSNGDEIHYSCEFLDDMDQIVDCKLKFKEGSYTVKDLAEVATFDAFANLEVSFSGIAPSGIANAVYTGSELSNYYFSIDRSSGLSNGDVVTVTIDSSDSTINSLINTVGKLPASFEQQYTVSGLDAYLSQASQLGEDALAAMQQQAADVFNAQVASNWDANSENLLSFDYLGNYLLTPKSQDQYGLEHNQLYLVYRVAVQDHFAKDDQTFNQTTTYYWFIRFNNVVVTGDGSPKCDLTRYTTPSNKFEVDSGINESYSTFRWHYYGFESLSELYAKSVTSQVDKYNHEDNVKEA